MRIKAVIFDMDGVLIDAKEWHYESLNRALAPYQAEISRWDHIHTYDGLPTRVKLDMLTKAGRLPRELHPTVQRLKQQYLLEIVEQSCQPRAQHIAALRGLRLLGLTVAVASNSIRDTVDRMLARAQLLPLLDFTLSNQDVPRPKPDPAIYLEAIRLAQVPPDACVVVEDNQHGVEAATRAGANVLRVESVDDVALGPITEFIASLERSPAQVTRSRRTAA